ncbi:hypothetical protein ACHHRT_09320 [Desulfurivibrio sp. D14AmB]|uniref:hypothetical protein n=1 Tax=Desulfurivibrio sp. D14AmB TaxID=3374370 RepID=UPI00376ED870
MKILNVYRSEPDGDVKKLVEIVTEGREATEFKLYGGEVDYDKLVDMVFEADKAICWW